MLKTLDPKTVTESDYTWYFLLRKTDNGNAFIERTSLEDIATNDLVISVIHNGLFYWLDEIDTQLDSRFNMEGQWLKW